MSSALERLVPLFTGINCRTWAQDMQAYLQTQECWDVVTRDYRMPTAPQGTPAQPARGTTAAVAAVPPEQEDLDFYEEELR